MAIKTAHNWARARKLTDAEPEMILPLTAHAAKGSSLILHSDPACATLVGEQLGGAADDQVARAGILRHPTRIAPVLGTGKAGRIVSAAEAEAPDLTREQRFRIWSARLLKNRTSVSACAPYA